MTPKGYQAKNHRRKISTRDLTLASGSKITLTLTGVDALDLKGEDRAFVFGLIDAFAAYETIQAHKAERKETAAGPSDGVTVTLSRVT